MNGPAALHGDPKLAPEIGPACSDSKKAFVSQVPVMIKGMESSRVDEAVALLEKANADLEDRKSTV